jgi:hypothetical protein
MSMEAKSRKDLNTIVDKINNHVNKQGIISMFIKGPPENDGFMWCGRKGGPGCWWNKEEAEGLKFISNLVLELGWDSSGYGFMMRFVQKEIKIQQLRRSPPMFKQDEVDDDLPTAFAIPALKRNLTQGGSSIFRDPNFEDDEGDPMADKGSPFYKTVKSFQLDTLEQGKNFAKSYQQSKFGKSMDDNNKKALDVMVNKGANEAANYMMKQAGGDYSRMRSMFG